VRHDSVAFALVEETDEAHRLRFGREAGMWRAHVVVDV
jgi:hypothetical protein